MCCPKPLSKPSANLFNSATRDRCWKFWGSLAGIKPGTEVFQRNLAQASLLLSWVRQLNIPRAALRIPIPLSLRCRFRRGLAVGVSFPVAVSVLPMQWIFKSGSNSAVLCLRAINKIQFVVSWNKNTRAITHTTKRCHSLSHNCTSRVMHMQKCWYLSVCAE